MIIDAIKSKYSLSLLLQRLQLSKSSYYYQENALSNTDKYFEQRTRIKELFEETKHRYGFRRINALLRRKGIILSEKIVRRIMKEECLVVKIKKTVKYNSYAGEISPEVENIINRDFFRIKSKQEMADRHNRTGHTGWKSIPFTYSGLF